MKAVRSGHLTRCLVPSGMLGLQGDRAGVVRVLLDEFQILEDLSFLLNFALAGRVVMDREHNRPAPRCNFLTVNIFDVHQQRKGTSFHFAAEVVGGAQLSMITTNKEVGSDILNIVCHGNGKEMENKEKCRNNRLGMTRGGRKTMRGFRSKNTGKI